MADSLVPAAASRRPPRRTIRLSPTLMGGALLAFIWVGCGDVRAEGPVGEPYPGLAAPKLLETEPAPFTEYATPAESLYVRNQAPRGPVSLLFYRGRGVARDGRGRAYLTDAAGSRILAVDSDLKVVRVIGGPDESKGGIGLPLSAAPTRAGALFVVDVEHDKGLLYFDSAGRYVGASTPPVLNSNLWSAPEGGLWAARSPYIYGFEPTDPEEPLLYRFDPLAGSGVGIAHVEPVAAPAWNRLANAGSVAVGQDGTAFFAFLLRNELRAYRPNGELLWRARRSLGFETRPPGVENEGGHMRLDLRPVTQALAMGPDGLLYALTASDSIGAAPDADRSPGHRRVEVYEPASGRLLRAGTVPAGWTTLASDSVGRVYVVDADGIVASAPPPDRRPLPNVVLEAFNGDSARFEDYRGKALLVNLWASWCGPCRRELPKLKQYYEGLDHDRVEFLAISEDTDVDAARAFAADYELPFPLFLGHGRMRDHFRYLGLPYTLIVDYRGRIAAEIQGFGSEGSWNRLTSALEAEMARTTPRRAAVDSAGDASVAGRTLP